MQTEGSFHGSLQNAAAKHVQDTAMSAAGVLAMSGNVAEATATSASGTRMMPKSAVMVSSKSRNAAFQRSQSRGRSRSVSPILRCVRSPVGLSIAQCHVQLAERTLASMMSSVG